MEVASRISPICRNLECSASNACDDALSGSDHRAGVNISCPAPVNSVNNFWPAIRGDLQTFANINTDILQSPMTAFDCSSTIGPIQKSLYMLLLYQFTFAQNRPKTFYTQEMTHSLIWESRENISPDSFRHVWICYPRSDKVHGQQYKSVSPSIPFVVKIKLSFPFFLP